MRIAERYNKRLPSDASKLLQPQILYSALLVFSARAFRVVLVSALAAAIGLVGGVVAFALYKLIGLFTNLFFFHRWASGFTSLRFHHLGY